MPRTYASKTVRKLQDPSPEHPGGVWVYDLLGDHSKWDHVSRHYPTRYSATKAMKAHLRIGGKPDSEPKSRYLIESSLCGSHSVVDAENPKGPLVAVYAAQDEAIARAEALNLADD